MTAVTLTARRSGWYVPQVLPFARAFSRCALRPALARAVPLYVVALLLSGSPIGPAVLREAVQLAPAILPGTAALWVLAFSRNRVPLFGAAQTEYLRTLPVASWLVTAAVLAALICIDAPWVWLCIATGDPAIATAGPAMTLAGHAALAGRRGAHLVALVGVLALATVVPFAWVAPIALGLAAIAAPWAWTVARIPRVAWTSHLHIAVPWIGVARALGACVIRADAELLRRAVVVLVVMTGVAALVVRNNKIDDTDLVLRSCLVVLALGVPIVLTRVVTGVIEAGWTLGWLYDATGARRIDRSIGGFATVALSGGTLGALHGVAVAMWSTPGWAWWLGPVEAAAGSGLAILLLGVAAASVTARGVDAIRLFAGIVVITTIAAFTLAAGLQHGALIGAPAAILAAILYHLRVIRAVPCS